MTDPEPVAVDFSIPRTNCLVLYFVDDFDSLSNVLILKPVKNPQGLDIAIRLNLPLELYKNLCGRWVWVKVYTFEKDPEIYQWVSIPQPLEFETDAN